MNQNRSASVERFPMSIPDTVYYPGISVTDRVTGTISEQAVSVVSINTTTKDVVIRRIGAGRNQTLSYNYAEAE
jgi:hypothetical protein